MTMLRYAFRADFKFGAMLLLHSAAAVLIWCSNSNAMGFLFRPPNCEQRQVLSQAMSPDGAWVATLYNNICSDGAFVTTISDSVEVTRRNEPATPMPVAGYEHPGRAFWKPLLLLGPRIRERLGEP